MVTEVDNHLFFDYPTHYLSLLAIYRLNNYIRIREQFWGRAALAPVICHGSGRFSLSASLSLPLRAFKIDAGAGRLSQDAHPRGARRGLRLPAVFEHRINVRSCTMSVEGPWGTRKGGSWLGKV